MNCISKKHYLRQTYRLQSGSSGSGWCGPCCCRRVWRGFSAWPCPGSRAKSLRRGSCSACSRSRRRWSLRCSGTRTCAPIRRSRIWPRRGRCCGPGRTSPVASTSSRPRRNPAAIINTIQLEGRQIKSMQPAGLLRPAGCILWQILAKNWFLFVLLKILHLCKCTCECHHKGCKGTRHFCRSHWRCCSRTSPCRTWLDRLLCSRRYTGTCTGLSHAKTRTRRWRDTLGMWPLNGQKKFPH